MERTTNRERMARPDKQMAGRMHCPAASQVFQNPARTEDRVTRSDATASGFAFVPDIAVDCGLTLGREVVPASLLEGAYLRELYSLRSRRYLPTPRPPMDFSGTNTGD